MLCSYNAINSFMKKIILFFLFGLLGYNSNGQSCLTNSLIINTGYNPITGTAITPGANGASAVTDPHWIVSTITADVTTAIAATPITGLVEVTPGNSADVVTTVGGWATNPASNPGGWISCVNSNEYYDNGDTTLILNTTLSRTFKMCTDDSIKFTFFIADDNYVSATSIDGTALLFSQPPGILLSTFSTFASFTQTVFLTAGTHTINIVTNNFSVATPSENPTGLDLYGTVSSATGSNSLVSESTTACLSYVCGTLPPCNSVTLPDSLSACPGTADTLFGAVTGPDSIISISWSPTTGLSSSTIADPVLTVGASGYYYLTVESLLPDNLVVNGDFSAGNTGFTSSYTYSPPPSTTLVEGDYSVYTDPHGVHTGFSTFGDHTTGTGNMLIVNGSPTPTDVWCETIPVIPYTNYDFSAWIANCSAVTTGVDVPIMQFKINGVLIGSPTTITTAPAVWFNFFNTWNSGASTTATICIYDENTTASGNDFAIDDISFEPICTVTDSIYISAAAPDTTLMHTDTTVCASVGTVTLTAPAGYTTHTWNTGATTATINVTTGGTYWVTETGSCIALSDTFHVTFTPVPAVNLGNDTTFCQGQSLGLHSLDTYVSPTYLWSTGSTGPVVVAATSGTYWLDVTVNGCTGSDTVVITVNPTPPLPLFTPVTPVCSGKPINLLASDTLGAVPPATYSWTGPNGFNSTQQNPIINPSTMAASGIYSLVATLNGCPSAMGTEAVLVDSTPANVTATSNSPICQGSDLDFFASSSTTGPSVAYNWTSATGSFTSTLQNPVIPAATTAASGFYSVSVTYNGICGAGATVLVTVNPIPVLASDSVTSPVCSGQTLGLYSTFSPTGGTYNWTGPLGFTSTMQNPSIPGVPTTAAGVYSVSETLNGCTSDTATMMVIVNSTPAVPGIGSNTPVCQGDTLQLTSADDTAGISYSWAGPNSFTSSLQDPFIANATPAAAGTYTVYAILGSCVNSAATIVSITQTPTLTPTSNSPVCSGDTLLLYANAPATATVSWTGPYDFTSLAPSPIRTNAVTEYSGIYEVTEFLNNCYGHAYDTVVVNQTPLPPWVTWLTYCQYYPAPPLMTVDGVGVLWYPADSVQSGGSAAPPFPSTTTVGSTFYYTTQTINGCTSAIDSIQVTVNPIPTVTVSPNLFLCPHTTATLTATDADPIAYYHWSPGLYLNDTNTASVVVNAITDEIYTVVASNQFGCADTASVSVTVYPAALISLGDSVTLYPGETYTMNPTTNCTSFSWFPPAGLSSDIISNPVASPLVSTEYTVFGQTQDGCVTSDSINIYVSANSLISLPNAFTPGTGANTAFKINKKGIVSLDYFRIFNRWGQKVFETTNIDAGWDGTFNGTPQPFGVFVYEIEAVSNTGQNFVVHGNVTLLR